MCKINAMQNWTNASVKREITKRNEPKSKGPELERFFVHCFKSKFYLSLGLKNNKKKRLLCLMASGEQFSLST